MPTTRHLDRQNGILVLVGTTKGAFLLAAGPERRRRGKGTLGSGYGFRSQRRIDSVFL
jgi:hypothetical protein